VPESYKLLNWSKESVTNIIIIASNMHLRRAKVPHLSEMIQNPKTFSDKHLIK
jgi:hypothetical protein